MIGDDGTRTELCANLVCPDRIKVYETESVDVAVALDVLEIAQGGQITLIGVVLPIKLDGDWAFQIGSQKCVSWTGTGRDGADGTGQMGWHGRNRKVKCGKN